MSPIRELYDNPAAMEPLLPVDRSGGLKELAAELLAKSARLGGALHPVTRRSVMELLRAMNSYYSNLIEGHNTHPIDIERAMQNDYAAEPAKRALQQESRAHIEVQKLIEGRLEQSPDTEVASSEFLCWIHREFYERLPEEFRRLATRSGGEDWVQPGEIRSCEVEVSRHLPPMAASLPRFLARFAEGYKPARMDPLQRIVAAAASHHRLAWIHPFLDGNGRVSRLFTHASLIQAKTEGHGLWMASRGLARRSDDYRAALAVADQPRQGDLDGRGNLSNKGLVGFCRFFLTTAIDQVEFMTQLLDLDAMQARITAFADLRRARHGAPEELSSLLRGVFLQGEVTRSEAAWMLGMPERTARRAMGDLLKDRLLVTDGPGQPLRLGFPVAHVGYYFPRLYPEGVELGMTL